MRRIPSFVLVRAFEAAARLGSFSLAAKELNLTPSAISHQIKQFEEFVGRELFARRQKRVLLSAAGQQLYQRLAPVLDALEVACAEVAVSNSSATLTVHCSPSFAIKCLGPHLANFVQEHPDIVVKLSSASGPFDLLNRPDIDVAISFGPGVAATGVDITGLGAEEIVPLCSPRLLETEMGDQRRLLERATLIDSEMNSFRWRDWFELNGFSFRHRDYLSFDRAVLAIAAAVDSMGIALESRRMAATEIDRGSLVVMRGNGFSRFECEAHFFLQRSNERHKQPGKMFKEWLLARLAFDSISST